MKRLLVLLCCLMCLLSWAAAEDLTILASGPAGDIRDICGEEGNWYLLTGQGVYRWAGPGAEPEQMVDLSLSQRHGLSPWAPTSAAERGWWEKGLSRIFLLDGQLMGLHDYTGQVSLIRDGEAVPYARLPEEQFFTMEEDELVAREIVGFAAQGDALYLAFSGFSIREGEVTELYAWKPGDEAMTRLDAPGLKTIFPGDNGCLLARLREDRTIRVYDPQEQAYGEILWTEGEDFSSGYVWDAQADTLTFTDWEGAVRVVSGGKAQAKAYLPVTFALVDRALSLPSGAYLAVHGGKLFVRALAEGEAERVALKIIGWVDDNLLTGFAAEHPEIAVSSAYAFADLETVQRSIVTGDSDVDVYMVNSNYAYSAICEKGYAAPLGGSETLTARAQAMYPAIRDILFHHGELVAYPRSMMMNSWFVNETKWEALGLGEVPRTWAGLVDFLALWESDYAEAYSDIRPLNTGGGFRHFVALCVRQYLLENEVEGELVSFDSEALRQVLTLLWEHRDLLEERPAECEYLLEPYQVGYGTSWLGEDKAVSILPPAISEDSPRRVAATLELFVLNPLSKHPEEAMAFLEYYAQQVDASWQYALSPENNVPLRGEGYEAMQNESLARIDALTSMLDTLEAADRRETEELIEAERLRMARREEESWSVSQESIEIYQAIAANLAIPLHSVYTGDTIRATDQVIDQAVALFSDGQCEVDQFIKLLNEKANMVFQEGL